MVAGHKRAGGSMKGIILAAGRGSRMGVLTDECPKCLTELAGRTLLDWQIGAMRQAGIEDVLIVGGYRKALLQGYACELIANPRWDRTNMVASLMCAASVLEQETCIVSYSDIVYHPDAVKRLAALNAEIAISYDCRWRDLWEARFDDPLADAETFREHNGCLTDIGRKTADIMEIRGQYMGLLRFSPAGWMKAMRLISTHDRSAVDSLDMTTLLQKLIGDNVAVHVVEIEGRWCEVDTEQDLDLYVERLGSDQGEAWSHDWRW
jgi:choline kinase